MPLVILYRERGMEIRKVRVRSKEGGKGGGPRGHNPPVFLLTKGGRA